jgi:hypothetical protein
VVHYRPAFTDKEVREALASAEHMKVVLDELNQLGGQHQVQLRDYLSKQDKAVMGAHMKAVVRELGQTLAARKTQLSRNEQLALKVKQYQNCKARLAYNNSVYQEALDQLKAAMSKADSDLAALDTQRWELTKRQGRQDSAQTAARARTALLEEQLQALEQQQREQQLLAS